MNMHFYNSRASLKPAGSFSHLPDNPSHLKKQLLKLCVSSFCFKKNWGVRGHVIRAFDAWDAVKLDVIGRLKIGVHLQVNKACCWRSCLEMGNNDGVEEMNWYAPFNWTEMPIHSAFSKLYIANYAGYQWTKSTKQGIMYYRSGKEPTTRNHLLFTGAAGIGTLIK